VHATGYRVGPSPGLGKAQNSSGIRLQIEVQTSFEHPRPDLQRRSPSHSGRGLARSGYCHGPDGAVVVGHGVVACFGRRDGADAPARERLPRMPSSMRRYPCRGLLRCAESRLCSMPPSGRCAVLFWPRQASAEWTAARRSQTVERLWCEELPPTPRPGWRTSDPASADSNAGSACYPASRARERARRVRPMLLSPSRSRLGRPTVATTEARSCPMSTTTARLAP